MKTLRVFMVFIAGLMLGGAPFLWRSQVETESKASIFRSGTSAEDNSITDEAMPDIVGVNPDFFASATPEQREVDEAVPLSGRLAFNAEKVHLVSARIAGRLDRIFVVEGSHVQQGQPVAALYSPEYISVQNELLLARNTWRTLQSSQVTRDLALDAEATLQAARERMQVIGASAQDVAALEQDGRIHEHLVLRAPISGVVIERMLAPGAFVNLGDNFLSLADMSTLWFVGNIYEQDYRYVRLGQELQLDVQALPGKQYRARIDMLSPALDTTSNTMQVRCLVMNDGMLRPDLFVTGHLLLGKRRALLVPAEAVVRSQQMDHVIVELATGHYRKRQVAVKPYRDGKMIVTEGLGEHEKIIVRGATLLNQTLSGGA